MSKPQVSTDKERIVFTKEMRRDYTILIPNMAPIHFELLRELFRKNDYNVELLRSEGHEVVDAGLKYVHNDTCYPALLAIGQLMHALESGKYDLNKTALMITQTGGGCRASNYIHLLRKALVKAGLSHIPVISLNLSGLEKNSGFKLTLPMLKEAVALLSYGDMLMLLSNQVRPYEVNEGETDRMLDSWIQRLSAQIHDNKCAKYEQLCDNLAKISAEFAQIEVQKRDIVKVGVVGHHACRNELEGEGIAINPWPALQLFDHGCRHVGGCDVLVLDVNHQASAINSGNRFERRLVAREIEPVRLRHLGNTQIQRSFVKLLVGQHHGMFLQYSLSIDCLISLGLR